MDLAALSGCLSEIQASLEHAGCDWRRAVSGDPGATPDAAQAIGESMAQALGGLRVAAMDAVARVLEATQRLMLRTIQAPDGLSPQAPSAIEAGLDAISEWLHSARLGHPISAMALWPVYCALKRELGEDPVDPGDLLDTPLRQGVPPEWALIDLQASQMAAVQIALERSLLGLLRNAQDPTTQAHLVVSLSRMAQVPAPLELRTTWWLAAAAADALRCGCLPAEQEVMRPLIRVVDRLRRHLRDRSDQGLLGELDPEKAPRPADAPATDWHAAQRSLLALIARATPGSPWADRIRLDHALPFWTPDPSGGQALGLSDPRARNQALEAIALAKDGWESVCSGERSALGTFGSALQRLDAALARLPYSGLQAVSEGLLALRRRLGDSRSMPTDDLALEVATCLLFVEWALRRRGGLLSGLEARCAEIRARLDPLPANASALPDWPQWLRDLARLDQEACTQAALEQALRTSLRECEQVLEAFFKHAGREGELSAVVGLLMQAAGVFRVLGREQVENELLALAQGVQRCVLENSPPDALVQEQMVARLSGLSLGKMSPCVRGSEVQSRSGEPGGALRQDTSVQQVFMLEARRLLDEIGSALASPPWTDSGDLACATDTSDAARSESLMTGWVDELLRRVHTLRGSAATAGANACASTLLDMEARLAATRRPRPQTSPDWGALIAALRADLAHLRSPLRIDATVALEPVLSRSMHASLLADRLHRVVRQASRDAGRPALLVIEGEHTPLTSDQMARLPDLLGHLLRNALAHGIEDAEVRQACGKPARGHVLLRLSRTADALCLEVGDDGRGPDLERIRERAKQMGLSPESDPASLLQLMFHPGLSTTDDISALAGRGVGLDAVRAQVLAMGGQIALSVPPGRGLTVTIRLPDQSGPVRPV